MGTSTGMNMSMSKLESAGTAERETRVPARARASRSRRASGRARRDGGPAGFGGRLSSARDRQKVRERNAAERTRVEEMLASAPIDAKPRMPFSPSAPSSVEQSRSPSSAFHLRALSSSPEGCPVCESGKVVRDEVFEAGTTLRLSECLNCEHRWTARPRARWSELGQRMTSRGGARVVAKSAERGGRFDAQVAN